MKKQIFILALLCPILAMCQPPNFSGKIINDNNEPVVAATLTIHSTGKKTVSNKNGEFIINYPPLSAPDSRLITHDSILITATGYKPKTLSLAEFNSQHTPLTIILARNITALDDVLVMAYGTTTKRLSVGNISKVSAADIQLQPVSNPLAALAGRVPGLLVTQTSGVAGSTINLQLRGRTSLDMALSRNDPLFIIDGVPFESGNLPVNQQQSAANNPQTNNFSTPSGISPFSTINPADIESIEVLKDAEATAIYGSRGAAGVILITTKKAKPGKASFNVTMSAGFSSITRSIDLLNTQQYLQMRREAFANDGLTPTITTAPDLLLWDTTKYYDFKNELIGGNAQTNDINLGMSAGSAATQFTIGAGYHRETTVFPGSFADTRASFRTAFTHSPVNKKWELRVNAIYAAEKNRIFRSDLTRFINLPPHLQLKNEDGTLNWSQKGTTLSSLGFSNPYAELARRYTATNNNLSANILLSYKITPVLTFRTSAGFNSFITDEITTIPRSSIAPETSTLASAQFANATRNNWIIEPQLEYSNNTAIGQWNILVGSTFQNRNANTLSTTGSGYTNDLLLHSLAAAANISADNDYSRYRYNAFFGRISYNWQQKYLLNLSARRDGSSRFGPGNRFSNFGAIGAAWIISAEPWMQRQTIISFAKLRSSYGITGNDQIGDYKYLDLWTNTANTYQGIPAFRPLSLFNPIYSWEKNKKLEVAAELGFLQDKISISAAYYNHRSSNQLINYRLPNQTGFTSVVKNLDALVENNGWEIALQSKNISRKNFSWTIAFNISIPKNRLINFPDLKGSSYNSLYVIGQPLSVIYGYRYLGVNPATGIYSYEDVNNDGKLSVEDKNSFGNLDPKYYGGFANTITVHQLQFDCFFEFRKQRGSNFLAGQYNYPAGYFMNQPLYVLDHWQKAGDAADIQRYTTGALSAAANGVAYLGASDAFYTDASYIRLKTIACSIDLPAAIVQRLKIQKAKFSVQAQNLFTITSYKGADPETQSFTQLPPLKTIVAAIQINF